MRRLVPSHNWNRSKSKNRSEGNLALVNPVQRVGGKTPRGIPTETKLPHIAIRRENHTERSRNNSQNVSLNTGNGQVPQENLMGKMLAELPIRRKFPMPGLNNNLVGGIQLNFATTSALASTNILYRLAQNTQRGRSGNTKPTTMLIETEAMNDGNAGEQKTMIPVPAMAIDIESERKELPMFGNPFSAIYDREYGPDFEETIIKEQPDFSNALKSHDVRPQLRAKMADWMVEVFANYHQYTSHHTWFLAIHVLDLYFKKAKRRLRDADVHLSGIAAMFIASKYEDVYHIPLRDFVDRVAHGKFTR
eukprot:TRINITY_DN19505_c0_g1_i1.p1 TRINITY_DN19505_c0_g1~~TRINITY_DN19505_c0_g1_i1.p1  ORF type:complete len:306 (+),score=48.12 TRINITY_DN19505_c0_g1_i1:196-1113(+)